MWAFVICFYDAEKDAITLGKKAWSEKLLILRGTSIKHSIRK